MHGKTSSITHIGEGVFEGLPSPLTVTRYHSLTIDPDTVPDTLQVTATTDSGIIMGVRHRVAPFEGVQFHPEAAAGPHDGEHLFDRFVALMEEYRAQTN